MLKSELIKRTGLKKDTIRHYEKIGLLNPVKLENGYFNYPESTLARIELIKHAKRLGMTLQEIASLIAPWENDEIEVEEKLEIFHYQLERVERKIQELQNTRSYLRHKLAVLREKHESELQTEIPG
ncbi:MAG: MerR family transcriptional regulator [Pseudomonadales bacterium]|nr:MerR family transcriptional regulator [Pseudomonadales bacterium]